MTSNMLKNLEQVVFTGAGCVEVEVQQHMVDLTADIISCSACGGSYEGGKKLFEQLRKHQKPFAANHQILSMPGGLRNLPTQAHLKIWRQDKELKQTLKEIVQERKHQFEKSHSESSGIDVLGRCWLMMKTQLSRARSAHLGMQSLTDACRHLLCSRPRNNIIHIVDTDGDVAGYSEGLARSCSS